MLQIQCALPAIVRRTAFLRIGFDDTFAFKQGLVGALNQIKQLFNYTFQIRAIRGKIFNLDVVTLAQIFQCPGHKLAASVCHNFGGQMMARPVVRVNVYPVLMTKTDFVGKSVLKQQTQRILPAL